MQRFAVQTWHDRTHLFDGGTRSLQQHARRIDSAQGARGGHEKRKDVLRGRPCVQQTAPQLLHQARRDVLAPAANVHPTQGCAEVNDRGRAVQGADTGPARGYAHTRNKRGSERESKSDACAGFTSKAAVQ